MAVEKGQSVYYAGVFAKADSPIKGLADLKGKRMAFGDVNSASSFVFPVAMMLSAHLDPARDLKAVRLTGSHANSLAALVQGQVDAAALSFESFDKAVAQGAVNPRQVRVVARSVAIPYPPLAMNTRLPEAMKGRLKKALGDVANGAGRHPRHDPAAMAGRRLTADDVQFPEARFRAAALPMAQGRRPDQGRDPQGRGRGAEARGPCCASTAAPSAIRTARGRSTACPSPCRAGQFCVVLGASGAGRVDPAAHLQRDMAPTGRLGRGRGPARRAQARCRSFGGGSA